MFYYFKILVIIAVILVILIKGIPIGITLLIRLIKGPYSAAYVIAYRKSLGKSPYSQAVKEVIVSHLMGFDENSNNKYSAFKTPTGIIFDGVNFGTSFKALIAERGNPFGFTVQRYEKWLLVAASYSFGKGDQRMRKIFFYLNDRLIGGECTYANQHNEQTAKIKEQLIERYKLPSLTEEMLKFYITDQKNDNLIFDATGFDLILHYGCNSDAEFQSILSTLRQSRNNMGAVAQTQDLLTL